MKTSRARTNTIKFGYSNFNKIRLFEYPEKTFILREIMFKRPSASEMEKIFLSNGPSYLLFTVNIARDMCGTSESLRLNPGLATLV